MIRLDQDLLELNKPVYFEGEAPQTLPDEYFTINEDYTSDNLNANNKPLECLYEFTLKWYTNNANNVYSGLNAAIALLKSKGYIISGLGYKNATYQNIWFSRQVDVEKIDYIGGNE